MAKTVNILPNGRVDIPDYKAQTADFARSALEQRAQALILAGVAAVAEGFRVEIADQSTSPGQFTIVNGVGLRRDGRLLNNEDDLRATRSATLSVDATYYVEIEWVEQESDVDARAFWDPTFDNGSDPSGDARATGREYEQNVATRLTPDWNIVSPISTSGFEYTTDPDSARIPVAVITVSGGVITGATTAPLQSVIRKAAAAGATSLQLLNTRAMLDAFTLTLDPGGASEEDVTVTANDRANGVLTLSAGTVNAHSSGTRVQVGGATPAEYLAERSAPEIPTTGTQDARPQLFRGDEEAGDVLAVDPAGTGDDRSDVSVESLKRYVDFLSAQIREMKFGAALGAEVGAKAPPASFPAEPRYYANAGGLLGARGQTVSVGNGTTTWGDYNATQVGSARTAIQNAIDALPASGGIVYLKAGTYAITSALSVTKPVTLVGDGKGATIIQHTVDAALDLNTAGGLVVLDGIALTNAGAGAAASIDVLGDSALSARNCAIDGILVSAGTLSGGTVDNCDIVAKSDSNGFALSGLLADIAFRGCNIQSERNDATARAVNLAATSHDVWIQDSILQTTAALPTYVIEHGGAALSADQRMSLTLEGCRVTAAAGSSTLAWSNGVVQLDRVRILDCKFTVPSGFGTLYYAHDLSRSGTEVRGCQFLVPQNGVGITVECEANADPALTDGYWFLMADCIFEQATTTALEKGIGLKVTRAQAAKFRNLSMYNCDVGVSLNLLDEVVFDGLDIRGSTGRGRAGFEAEANCALDVVTFQNCYIRDIEEAVNCYGFNLDTLDSGSNQVRFVGNQLSSIGNSGAFNARGISVGSLDRATISGNTFDFFRAGGENHAIFGSTLSSVVISDNVIRNIGDGSEDLGEAIRIEHATEVSVTENTIDSIGSASMTGAGTGLRSAAISIGTSGGASVGSQINVSNNVLEDIVMTGSWSAIHVEGSQRVNVSNNNIRSLAATGIGISVESEELGLVVRDVSITGNQVSGFLESVVVLFDDAGGYVNDEGAILIANNVLKEFSGESIRAWGDNAKCLTVAGNLCQTQEPGVWGIDVYDFDEVVVTGNTVGLHGGGAAQSVGISVTTFEFASIAGNSVRTTGTGSLDKGITANGTNNPGAISGNAVDVDTGHAIDSSSNYVYVSGNCAISSDPTLAAIDSPAKYLIEKVAGAPSRLDVTAGAVLAHVNIEGDLTP